MGFEYTGESIKMIWEQQNEKASREPKTFILTDDNCPKCGCKFYKVFESTYPKQTFIKYTCFGCGYSREE